MNISHITAGSKALVDHYQDLISKSDPAKTVVFYNPSNMAFPAIIDRLFHKLHGVYPEGTWMSARYPDAAVKFADSGDFDTAIFLAPDQRVETLKKRFKIEAFVGGKPRLSIKREDKSLLKEEYPKETPYIFPLILLAEKLGIRDMTTLATLGIRTEQYRRFAEDFYVDRTKRQYPRDAIERLKKAVDVLVSYRLNNCEEPLGGLTTVEPNTPVKGEAKTSLWMFDDLGVPKVDPKKVDQETVAKQTKNKSVRELMRNIDDVYSEAAKKINKTLIDSGLQEEEDIIMTNSITNSIDIADIKIYPLTTDFQMTEMFVRHLDEQRERLSNKRTTIVVEPLHGDHRLTMITSRALDIPTLLKQSTGSDSIEEFPGTRKRATVTLPMNQSSVSIIGLINNYLDETDPTEKKIMSSELKLLGKNLWF